MRAKPSEFIISLRMCISFSAGRGH